MRHSTKHFIRALLFAVAAASVVPVARAAAQAGQAQAPVSLADFSKLRWLEGTWEGSAPGETTIYQQFKLTNDSTFEIGYYSDPQLTRETGNGRLYLSVGHVYHTFGPGRWGATHVGADGVFLVPQVNARNTFAWRAKDANSWTSTQRTGVSGHDRVTVYEMKRVKGS